MKEITLREHLGNLISVHYAVKIIAKELDRLGIIYHFESEQSGGEFQVERQVRGAFQLRRVCIEYDMDDNTIEVWINGQGAQNDEDLNMRLRMALAYLTGRRKYVSQAKQ